MSAYVDLKVLVLQSSDGARRVFAENSDERADAPAQPAAPQLALDFRERRKEGLQIVPIRRLPLTPARLAALGTQVLGSAAAAAAAIDQLVADGVLAAKNRDEFNFNAGVRGKRLGTQRLAEFSAAASKVGSGLDPAGEAEALCLPASQFAWINQIEI